ncbi:GIY-YIG nuclease family protein [Helicobacter baculiformis]|uniref:GIY-YIG nuclease family protein n=1 Tax=Helicobacter baculiformis TaxID=427351 RepID=A0ABV7ZIS6_9HELI|nr:GIY-YIG nuclease family protein [Helicobacter baculiformis]
MQSSQLENLPERCGVYLYFDRAHQLLYIGKAKNLKKRIVSYFSVQGEQLLPNPRNNARVRDMVAKIAHVELHLTSNEHEALLLEDRLIKKHQPRYNILLKDSKTYPYVCFDPTLPYPVWHLQRHPCDHLRCFGPFSSAAKEILESVLDLIPLVQSPGCVRGKHACIFYEIKRCLAPCEGKISPKDYANLMQEGVELLENLPMLCALLEARMRALSSQERFEEAAIQRDRWSKIHALLQRLQGPLEGSARALQILLGLSAPVERVEVFDVSHHAQSHCVGAMVVFDKGAWVKSAYRRYILQGKDEYSQMRELLERRAKRLQHLPHLWLLDGGRAQVRLAVQILERAQIHVEVVGIAKAKIASKTRRSLGDVPDILYTRDGVLRLRANDPCLQFLQRLRDEAHRYALAFHRHKFLAQINAQ